MNSFDHFVKAELGVKYYGRYVDDFYLVDSSKDRLLEHKKKIVAYLKNELHLNIHPRMSRWGRMLFLYTVSNMQT